MTTEDSEPETPEQLRARWITALTSGYYKQGTGSLRPTDDTYCCLGVLCRILGLEWKKYEGDDARSRGYEHSFWAIPTDTGGFINMLPNEIAAKVAMDRHTVKCLSSQNDNGTKFTEIADFIANAPFRRQS